MPKEDDLRSIFASLPSENRILSIERTLREFGERLAVLEEQQRQKSSREERSFSRRNTLIIVVATVISSNLATWVLTKLNLI